MYAVSSDSDVYHIARQTETYYVTSCGQRFAAPAIFATPQNFPILHVSLSKPVNKNLCSSCERLEAKAREA